MHPQSFLAQAPVAALRGAQLLHDLYVVLLAAMQLRAFCLFHDICLLNHVVHLQWHEWSEALKSGLLVEASSLLALATGCMHWVVLPAADLRQVCAEDLALRSQYC